MLNLGEIPKDFKLEVSVEKQSIIITSAVLFIVIMVAVAVGVSVGNKI